MHPASAALTLSLSHSMATPVDALQLEALAVAVENGNCAQIAVLTRGATSAVVCEAGCDALREFLTCFVGADDPVTSEESQLAVEALLSALRSQPASASVQHRGCVALSLWCTSPEARAFAGGSGALDAVVAALLTHARDADVAAAGCMALGGMLAFTSANVQRAEAAGVLGAVLAAMRAHSSCMAVQRYGCYVLEHATAPFDSVGYAAGQRNRTAAVELGAIELVVKALEHTDVDVQAAVCACCALSHLVLSSPENGERASRCGAVVGLLRVMRAPDACICAE